MHSCWLTRALLTFDVLAVVCAALAKGPEVDRRGALGRPAGINHVEGLEGRDQYLLLLREEGVALDGGPSAGPDVKQGVFPKCHTPLQERRAKPPSLTVALVPEGWWFTCSPRNTWWHLVEC